MDGFVGYYQPRLGDDEMILVCYDGSADARAAIDGAGELLPGNEATVLVLWETVLETMSRDGLGMGMGLGMIGGYSDDQADAAVKQAGSIPRPRVRSGVRTPGCWRLRESSAGMATLRPKSSGWRPMWTRTW